MRCPNCSQWNRASLPRCIRCGTELPTQTPVQPSWRAALKDDRALKEYISVDEDGWVDAKPDDREVLAAEMAELKARKDDGERRLRQLQADTAYGSAEAQDAYACDDQHSAAGMPQQPAADDSIFDQYAPPSEEPTVRSARVSISGMPQDEPGETQVQHPLQPARPARNPRGTRVILSPDQWQDSRSYDPIVDEMQSYNVFKQPPNLQELPQTPSRRRSRRRIIRLLTTLLVIVVLCLAGAIGFSAWQQYQASQSDKNKALVTASMQDDLAAHTILIPGEEGQLIYIAELHDTYQVVGGFANIVIPDHTWYDELSVINEDSMSVTLTPFVKTSGGSQKPLGKISYDIDIPLSPIQLVTPDKMRTEVTTAMYTLVFNIREGSTVMINGVDMSDAIDENGQLTYNATVQPVGDNTYTIDVRSPYCRNNSMEVVLYRAVQEIPLDLAATTYTSTSLSEYQISCTTLPGAEIDILSPHSDLNITKLDSTGEFTFYAVFDKIGYNTVSIQATYPGKKTSRVDYTIYYLPNPDVYTPKAWSLSRPADYAELVGNIAFRADRSQVYVAMGEIDHFVSESPQMAVIYCSEDGKSQPVLVENQSKTTWKKGTYYRIYADVYASYNGMPWLIARYTYLD